MAVVAVAAVGALGAATMGKKAKTSHEVRFSQKFKPQSLMSNYHTSNLTILRRHLTLVVATLKNLNQERTTPRVLARWDLTFTARRDQARGPIRNSALTRWIYMQFVCCGSVTNIIYLFVDGCQSMHSLPVLMEAPPRSTHHQPSLPIVYDQRDERVQRNVDSISRNACVFMGKLLQNLSTTPPPHGC